MCRVPLAAVTPEVDEREGRRGVLPPRPELIGGSWPSALGAPSLGQGGWNPARGLHARALAFEFTCYERARCMQTLSVVPYITAE